MKPPPTCNAPAPKPTATGTATGMALDKDTATGTMATAGTTDTSTGSTGQAAGEKQPSPGMIAVAQAVANLSKGSHGNDNIATRLCSHVDAASNSQTVLPESSEEAESSEEDDQPVIPMPKKTKWKRQHVGREAQQRQKQEEIARQKFEHQKLERRKALDAMGGVKMVTRSTVAHASVATHTSNGTTDTEDPDSPNQANDSGKVMYYETSVIRNDRLLF